MYNNYFEEIKNIRITLVVLTVIFTLSTCCRNDTQYISNDSKEVYPKFSSSNMVDFGNGNFGVLTSDSDYDNGFIRIYHYDKKTNEVTFKKEQALDELQE